MCPLVEIPVPCWCTVFLIDVLPSGSFDSASSPTPVSPCSSSTSLSPRQPGLPKDIQMSLLPQITFLSPSLLHCIPQISVDASLCLASSHDAPWVTAFPLSSHNTSLNPRTAMNACSVALANCSACLQGP